MKMEKRVAIVGAGINGLVACKYAIAKGFQPTVFEAQDKVGGLWNHTLESTRLQNTRHAFQFSDFPWPPSITDDFPRDIQVLDYLQSYAHHFGLFPYIKFNSRVIGIDYVSECSQEEEEKEEEEEMLSWELWGGTGKAFSSKGKWKVRVQHDQQHINSDVKEYKVGFVILCMGRFSGVPNIPEFPKGCGPEVFDGMALHSMDFSAMENTEAKKLIRGKKIVVIGSSKSAIDIAALCATVNGNENPCRMIVRTPHWMLPSYNVWGIHLGFLYFNRFSELLVHKPGEGPFLTAMASLLSPLRWGIAKFTESYLRWKLPLKKYDMIPPHSFLQEISSCSISILPDHFFNKVEEGSIVIKRSERFDFCKNGVVILDRDITQPIKADIVILATGYRGERKLTDIFTSTTFQKYITPPPYSTIPLYRQIIHPRIPQVAAIGYSESLNNLYTSEMRCKWLSNFLEGSFQLPSIQEMEKDVATWDKYMKLYAGGKYYYRTSCIETLHICYIDQLCKDFPTNPKKKRGFISYLFHPYGPADFLEFTAVKPTDTRMDKDVKLRSK